VGRGLEAGGTESIGIGTKYKRNKERKHGGGVMMMMMMIHQIKKKEDILFFRARRSFWPRPRLPACAPSVRR
jgi:hypothetical protein